LNPGIHIFETDFFDNFLAQEVSAAQLKEGQYSSSLKKK